MRVISGEFRGRRLNMVPGTGTRPTADKIKESMFSMMGAYFDGGQALDLYAGTGGLGIEAVSRGMAHATLVDSAYAAIKTLKENVALTKAPDRFTIIKSPVNKAIAQFAAKGQVFDLIMMDPPYAQQEVLEQLAAIAEGGLIRPDGLVLVETGTDVVYPETVPGYTMLRHHEYAVAQVAVFRREVENG